MKQKYKGVCIGGPADGKTITMDTNFLEVPMRTPMRMTDRDKGPEGASPTQLVIYHHVESHALGGLWIMRDPSESLVDAHNRTLRELLQFYVRNTHAVSALDRDHTIRDYVENTAGHMDSLGYAR